MEINIHSNDSSASLWLSIISLIIASLAFLIPYFRPHILSKKNFWIFLDNKFSIDDYKEMANAIKEEKYYLHYIDKFRRIFCDFSNFNTIEGFFLQKIDRKINRNKEIYSSIIKYISEITNSEKNVFTMNDVKKREMQKQLVELSEKGAIEYLKLKELLTLFPYNL